MGGSGQKREADARICVCVCVCDGRESGHWRVTPGKEKTSRHWGQLHRDPGEPFSTWRPRTSEYMVDLLFPGCCLLSFDFEVWSHSIPKFPVMCNHRFTGMMGKKPASFPSKMSWLDANIIIIQADSQKTLPALDFWVSLGFPYSASLIQVPFHCLSVIVFCAVF